MKLREAITKAGNEADLVVIQVWADTFLASLEASGFVVVPKEATDDMVVSGDEAIIVALNRPHSEWSDNKTPAALCLTAAIAARPTIED